MEFSWRRFTSLLQRDFLLHRNKMLLAFLLLVLLSFVGVIAGHHLINLHAGGGLQMLLVLFIFLLWIGGGWFTSTNLGDLQSSASRIHYLSLPASSLEKLLSKWLYTLPLYALSISLITWFFFKGYLWMFGDVLPMQVWPLAERMEKTMSIAFLQLYVFGHAVAFFSSFYFNNYVAVKGALASIIAFLGAAGLWAVFRENQGMSLLELIEISTGELMTFLIEDQMRLLILVPIFWLSTFWVLKRKAV